MVKEDKDFSVPTFKYCFNSAHEHCCRISADKSCFTSTNTGIHVSSKEDLQISSYMNRLLNDARVDPTYTSVSNTGHDRNVSQVGWSSPVSRNIAYRVSDSEDTPFQEFRYGWKLSNKSWHKTFGTR